MQRCLELASLGAGYVAPNPMVGAVLVHAGKIIGEGFHKEFGGKHAEVNAIESVPDASKHFLQQSVLYINLEPCSHFGKTPPCTDLIIENRIPMVVIGCLDPNPKVSGKGVKKITDAGLLVKTGTLEIKCRELNKHFMTFHEKKRPHITLKWAQSNDGFIAGVKYEKKHLTNTQSDILVHKMRSEHMAIFVGGKTILADNPKLTLRLWEGKNPIRMSFDNKGNIKAEQFILDGSVKTILFNFNKELVDGNIEFVKMKRGEDYVKQILDFLSTREINSILV
ncbi:MAG: bifunctional diaminohydroxyphosphoribosylaminopyrimidine deaminase/5-amino-6-(5-phosphoribosylamino)uracil reductase RibD, partial [Chitinophagales bacterium]